MCQQVRMASWQLSQVLESEGVARIETVGRKLDPHLHEVDACRPSTQFDEGTVIEELRPGYLIGVDVLRPAHVVVSQGPVTSP